MAEVQRRRDKEKKDKKSIDVLTDVLDQVIAEKSQPKDSEYTKQQIDIQSPSQSPTPPLKTKKIPKIISPITSTPVQKVTPSQLKPGTVDPRVKPILPTWVNKPWRWMVPEDPNLKKQWLITWGDFLVDFAHVLNFHIIDLQEISMVYPFQNQLLHKKLTIPQLVMISEHLVDLEKARWWNDERTRLRVYWKTLKSHADDLFEFAFQNGYDMVTAFDIVKMKQSWSTLPPSDIRLLMKLMVDTNRAFWADSERRTIQFIYN